MEPGTRLAHYEILEAIGKGGMGEVWRAKDTKLARDVAIKTLPPEFAQDEERLARFEREARLLASLNHPNIAAIHGFEQDQGTHFLVMELVEGDTLGDRIKRGPVPVEEALTLALQIADALKAAHESGVIHRDLKPDNIKVGDDGNVKVLDFGLAKALSAQETEVNVSNSPTLSMAATQAGVILGTAAYMSPEQAKGRSVDRRADIWAFGCLLYEMLSGRQSFGASDVTESLAAVITLQPQWNALPEDLHPRLRETVERCLEKQVAKRYQDIGDVRNDIEQVLADPDGLIVQPGVRPVQGTPQSKLSWVAAIVVAVIIASVAGWMLKPLDLRPVVRFEYALPEGRSFIGTGRSVLSISPDGRHFVFNTDAGFYLRPMNELTATLVPGTDGTLRNPFFSPDGEWIGYFSINDIQLQKVAISGGAPVPLADVTRNVFGASWGADGDILYGQADGIWRVSENGGDAELLIPTEPGEQAHGPQLLPGGEWVLFTLATTGGPTRWDEASIVAYSLSSGDQQVIQPRGTDARYLSTGHLVYASEGVLWASPFDPGNLEIGAQRLSMIEYVARANVTGTAQFSISDTGTLIFTPGTGVSLGGESVLVTVDRSGNVEPISDEQRRYVRPRVSPDGARIAVEVTGTQGDTHIWLMDAVTGLANQLTFEGSLNQMPLWTADSQTVVFRSDRAGETPNSIYRQSANFDTPAELVIEREGVIVPTDLSVDGVLVFHEVEGQAGIGDIWTLDIESPEESAEVFLATENNEVAARFSPDGRWLAYASDESGAPRVYVEPYPRTEGGRRQLSDDDERFAPVWSPDSSELYSVQGPAPGRLIATPTQTTSGFSVTGSPEELYSSGPLGLTLGSDILFSALYDVMPDGDRFVWTSSREQPEAGNAGPPQIIVVENWFEELKERVPVN